MQPARSLLHPCQTSFFAWSKIKPLSSSHAPVCKGHAGTVPMPMRKDPLVAAAAVVLWVNGRCGGAQAQGVQHEHPPDQGPADGGWQHKPPQDQGPADGGVQAGGVQHEHPLDHGPADGLVCTVGSLSVWPGASNVIPGSVSFTIDIRWPPASGSWIQGSGSRAWRSGCGVQGL